MRWGWGEQLKLEVDPPWPWPRTLRPQPLSAPLTRRLYLSRKGGGRATKLVPGESVLGEKRVSSSEGDEKIEYRAWNPFHSKLTAAILGCVDHIHIRLGAKILYLEAASGTTVSQVFDVVWSTQLNSPTILAVTSSTWPRGGPTLFL